MLPLLCFNLLRLVVPIKFILRNRTSSPRVDALTIRKIPLDRPSGSPYTRASFGTREIARRQQ
jgi:hypothetical protein